MNLDTEAIKILAKEIVKVMNENNSSLPFDRTAEGKIIEKTKKGYLVAVEGDKLDIPVEGEGEFERNQTVKVYIPQGNKRNAYLIVPNHETYIPPLDIEALNIPSIHLLWENPSPASSFAAQDITVPDMTQYTFIKIEIELSTDYPTEKNIEECMFSVGGGMSLRLIGSSNQGRRQVDFVDATTIRFGTATYNGSTQNKYGVPLRIYGIKYVVK